MFVSSGEAPLASFFSMSSFWSLSLLLAVAEWIVVLRVSSMAECEELLLVSASDRKHPDLLTRGEQRLPQEPKQWSAHFELASSFCIILPLCLIHTNTHTLEEAKAMTEHNPSAEH